MCMSSPRMPPPAPPPPPPPPAPTENVQEVQDARERERRRSLAADGKRSTMLTGADGVTAAAPIGQKVLLGA